ncbi:hypothetical protein Acr_00g0099330 [Actinidia rufa]|uniref:Uncharacterized protein n=1 Tax=Actinidia rufa TaxID=165716 RepID=A0A7J0DZR1_9ERIC|nr:hypothetical protein Acr_00g0099330 [Actinidia rufa]
MAKGKGKPKGTSSEANGVVIREKLPRDEMPDILPLKKGKQVANTKKKRLIPLPEDKKKGPVAKPQPKASNGGGRAEGEGGPHQGVKVEKDKFSDDFQEIDPELVEDDEEEEKDELVNNPPPQ